MKYVGFLWCMLLAVGCGSIAPPCDTFYAALQRFEHEHIDTSRWESGMVVRFYDFPTDSADLLVNPSLPIYRARAEAYLNAEGVPQRIVAYDLQLDRVYDAADQLRSVSIRTDSLVTEIVRNK